MMNTQEGPHNSRLGMWVSFFSLLLGGVTVHIAGREPAVLYFDIVFGLWITYRVFWKGFFPSLSDSIVRIGTFCLLSCLVSALFSRDILRGIIATKVLAVGLLVYAVAKRVPLGLFAPALFGACASLLLVLNYQDVRYGDFEGLSGLKDEIEITLGRSNYVASILILLIPLAVAGACLNNGKKRWFFTASAMLMLSGLFVTMSRGAMLAMVGATLLSLPFLRKAGVNIKNALVALALLGLTVALVPADLLETNVALFAYRLENPDFNRQEIMRASWESFTENPVLGVGPGQLGNALAQHMMVPPFGANYYNAHNLIIDSLAEMGLPTGLALLTMVGILMRRAWVAAANHATPFNVAIWIALLAAVTHNMVEASFEGQQFQVVFWVVAAMVGRESDILTGTLKTHESA
jgi:O-antigen ligase